LSYIK